MKLAIYGLYLWFTSNQMAAILYFAPVLAPVKNDVNHMTLSTFGPNLLLLEESELNSPFIALNTPD